MTEAGHPALIDYPERARVGRVVPKNRIMVAGAPGRRVRDQLTAQVARITWQYKLAPETLNLKGSKAVPEVQIFRVALKPAGLSDDLPVEVLKCIDRAIGFPLIFELISSREDGARRDAIRVAATYKRPSEADASKWVIDDYFATDWLPADTPRAPLPVALGLPRLYEQLLRELLPIKARPGESMAALVERHGRITAKLRECRRLKARIQREKQFNRKVEINRQLQALMAELDTLRETTIEGSKQHG
ncbi:MAG: methyl-accepting chemotaxis protein [Salinisphaeraceae bacterium]|nr:methyl-accepting chemotaxis protein [Salinisphaeraceae bacterium]